MSVSNLRSDYLAKSELLLMIQNGSNEIKALRRMNQKGTSTAGKRDWNTYLKQKATRAGISEGLNIQREKKGNETSSTEELLYSLSADAINIRQAVRLAHELEAGPQPVKIRRIQMKTKGWEGYLSAKWDISTFALKEKK